MNLHDRSRRRFLRDAGVCLALPLLESLTPLAAKETAGTPRRMVCICTSFGLYGPSFVPEGTGRDYRPSEYVELLGELRRQVTVFSGISHPEIGGDHASEACFLTGAKHPNTSGFRNRVSLDFLAGRHVGPATRFPLLSFSTQNSGTLTHNGTGAPVPAWHKPSEIFARMFLAGNPKDVQRELARLKRGQSVLDRMGDQFAALSAKVSARDRRQLADYTQAVRDMEHQFQADEVWAQRPKPTVSEPAPQDISDRSDNIGRTRLLYRLTRLALQTDSSRVVSIFIRGMDLKPPIPGVTEDHHNLTHHGRNPDKIAQLRIIERAEIKALADFLEDLRTTEEPGGTLLDQTQVLYGSNLGDASSHNTTNLPILLAGGGYRHGQHIAGDRRNNIVLGKLFVSMLQRFGVETETFGDVTGTIDGLE